MKIRIKGNSVRLRLSKSALEEFELKGVVKEQTSFGASTLTYQLESADIDVIAAKFENNTIAISIPLGIAEKWTSTELVGFNAEVKFDSGQPLFILIEKDFQCLAPREGEDESDLFKNPLMEE